MTSGGVWRRMEAQAAAHAEGRGAQAIEPSRIWAQEVGHAEGVAWEAEPNLPPSWGRPSLT